MKKALLVALILTAVILTACSSGGGSPSATIPAPVPADYAGKTNPLAPDATTAGAEIFKTNCENCHGPQGHGDGPAGAMLDPTPKNLPELLKMPGAGDDFLFWRISTGREGTVMIAWNKNNNGTLTDEQIWQVIAFIRTLK